jgi:hypothetical protein
VLESLVDLERRLMDAGEIPSDHTVIVGARAPSLRRNGRLSEAGAA